MFENSFALGFDFAANRYGLSKNQLMIKMAAENEIADDPAIQKLYSTVGAYILKKAGLQNSVEYRILEKCAGYNASVSEYTRQAFIKPVMDVLEKYAGVSDAVSTLGGLSHTYALSTLTAGALGGAALWGLHRASTVEDAETAAKFKQARKYRQLAREIKNQIAYEKKKLENEKAVVTNDNHNSQSEYQF